MPPKVPKIGKNVCWSVDKIEIKKYDFGRALDLGGNPVLESGRYYPIQIETSPYISKSFSKELPEFLDIPESSLRFRFNEGNYQEIITQKVAHNEILRRHYPDSLSIFVIFLGGKLLKLSRLFLTPLEPIGRGLHNLYNWWANRNPGPWMMIFPPNGGSGDSKGGRKRDLFDLEIPAEERRYLERIRLRESRGNLSASDSKKLSGRLRGDGKANPLELLEIIPSEGAPTTPTNRIDNETGQSEMYIDQENKLPNKSLEDFAFSELPGRIRMIGVNLLENYLLLHHSLEMNLRSPRTFSFLGYLADPQGATKYVNEIVTAGRVVSHGADLRISVITEAIQDYLEDGQSIGYHPEHGEDVKGFLLRADDRIDYGEVLIKTDDRRLVEEIHLRFIEKLNEVGSVKEALDWLLERSQWGESGLIVPYFR